MIKTAKISFRDSKAMRPVAGTAVRSRSAMEIATCATIAETVWGVHESEWILPNEPIATYTSRGAD